MILICPACSTKYVVKDGAIPPGGRQVRCAACKHSWHQDAEITSEAAEAETAEQAGEYAASVDAPLAEAPTEAIPPVSATEDVVPLEAGADDLDVAAAPAEQVGDSEPAAPPERDQWPPLPGSMAGEGFAQEAGEEEFTPFYYGEPVEPPRRRFVWVAVLLILVALAAAAVWYLGPDQLRTRLGIASIDESPLEVMVTTQNWQTLASGNQLFTVGGRVINPTNERQRVPPIKAEVLDASGQRVLYSWTIAPPSPTLAPGKSASFNSAEVDVPEGGTDLRLTFGGPA